CIRLIVEVSSIDFSLLGSLSLWERVRVRAVAVRPSPLPSPKGRGRSSKMINPTISEWLNSIARWIHVFAGIMWVGTTYYFTWLDARLTEEEKAMASAGKSAQIWMVHSGGFYAVEKRKVPDELSRKLHWFRWEAGTTWLSGMALLIVVYYLGGGALIDRDVADIGLLVA